MAGKLSDQEMKLLFDYFDRSIDANDKISYAELAQSAAPDLDGDKIISNVPLYRKMTTQKSRFTGNTINVYSYSTDQLPGFEPYVVDGQHVSEQQLGASTITKWLDFLKHEFESHDVVTWDEFKQAMSRT